MEDINSKLEILEKLEGFQPPTRIYFDVIQKIKILDRKLMLRIGMVVIGVLISSFISVLLIQSTNNDFYLDNFFSTNYNIYGYE
jgi:hypothetical protein